MGVKGLWRLLAPVGKPISLESLEGKILAVDVSIWLNKAAKGMRDKHGNAIYNAHLVLIFHRICKLLFYGVRPIFVFDGGVPELKKKTLKARRDRRISVETKRNKTKERMLHNYLQTKALETVTGTKSSYKLNLKERKEADMFELSSQPVASQSQSDSSSEDDMMNEDEWLKTLNESHIQAMFQRPDLVDTDSEEFNKLPPEVKHELLTEIKDSHRKRYRQKDQKEVELPEESNDFSSFQLENLMKRGRITHQIDQLRRDMNSSMTAQFIQLYSDDVSKAQFNHNHVESKQYASNEKQRYILIKKVEKKKSKDENVLFKTSLDDDYLRFKQREENVEEKELGDTYQRLERPAAKFQLVISENAKRKRFGSDSSEELNEVLESCKRQCKDTSSTNTTTTIEAEQIIKDEVEYMSSDSSTSAESDADEKKVSKDLMETSTQIPVDTFITTNRAIEDSMSQNAGSLPILADTEKIPVFDVHNSSHDVTSKDNENLGGETETTDKSNSKSGIPDQVGRKQVVETSVEHLNEAKSDQHKEQCSSNEQQHNSTSNLNLTVDTSQARAVDTSQARAVDTTQARAVGMTENIKENMATEDISVSDETRTSEIVAENKEENVPINNVSFSPCSSTTPSASDFLTPVETKQANVGFTHTQVPVRKSQEELVAWQDRLTREQHALQKDTQKQGRQAATLTTEMYQDVQALLQLFGIPYLVSPAEAEAQCAQLDYSKLTDGSVTDDSDAFLFGARRVYKNIFNQKKYAECYVSKEIEKRLYLTREKLIALAFLTGSDYTEGVQGIGSITGMEVLHEFSRNKAKETLGFFKEWVKSKSREFKPGSSLKSKLKDVDLPRSFNSSSVWEAYLSPAVDTSDEAFEWGEPDVMAIKEFSSEKFGWLHSRTNEMLQPILERLKTRKEKQKTLKDYFKPTVNIEGSEDIGSKRLQKILQRMASGATSNQEEGVSPGNINKMESEEQKQGKQKITEFDDFLFEDTSIETDLLDINIENEKWLDGPSSKREHLAQSTMSSRIKDVDTPGPSRRNTSSKQSFPKTSSWNTKAKITVSSNEKVQAKKVENLIKAAAESLKPASPFIKMQHVNNIVRNKMFQQRKTVNNKGRKQKQKAAMSLLEEVEALKSSSSAELKPLESSESDSD